MPKYKVVLTYTVDATHVSNMIELLDIVYKYGSPEESQYGKVIDEQATFEGLNQEED